MPGTKAAYGTVMNKNMITDKQSGKVAAAVTLQIGWVYQDGANGWKQVPTSSAIDGSRCFWNEKIIDNSAGALGDKTGTFWGEGALVVGKAEGAITVGQWCGPGTTTAGETKGLATPSAGAATTAEIDEITTWMQDKTAIYKGHVLENNAVDGLCTDGANGETDVVFLVKRGG